MNKAKTQKTETASTEAKTPAPEKAVVNVQRLRKISTREIVSMKATKGLFMGIVKNIATKETVYGDAVQFNGIFQLNVEDVESGITHVFKSSVLYLPGVAADELAEAVSSGEAEAELKFAINVFQVENKNSKTGYEWRFNHLLELQAVDPLSEIKALMG